MTFDWTDEAVAYLRDRWDEGWTGSQIADKLGIGRNAVIGKAHRLNLPDRQPGRHDRDGSRPQLAIPPAEIVNRRRTAAAKAARRAPETVRGEFVPPRRVQQRSKDKTRPRVALLDLGPHTCRWPFGDPRDHDFGFCGCRAVPERPYCAEHERVSHP